MVSTMKKEKSLWLCCVICIYDELDITGGSGHRRDSCWEWHCTSCCDVSQHLRGRVRVRTAEEDDEVDEPLKKSDIVLPHGMTIESVWASEPPRSQISDGGAHRTFSESKIGDAWSRTWKWRSSWGNIDKNRCNKTGDPTHAHSLREGDINDISFTVKCYFCNWKSSKVKHICCAKTYV